MVWGKFVTTLFSVNSEKGLTALLGKLPPMSYNHSFESVRGKAMHRVTFRGPLKHLAISRFADGLPKLLPKYSNVSIYRDGGTPVIPKDAMHITPDGINPNIITIGASGSGKVHAFATARL